MTVLIVGFNDYSEVDRIMQELIESSGCYLFTVVCGGLGKRSSAIGVGERWAISNGAPVIYIYKDNIDELMLALEKEVDYIVIKIDSGTPIFWKNFMMKLKEKGKHGTVVTSTASKGTC